jgi:hypothetical protein
LGQKKTDSTTAIRIRAFEKELQESSLSEEDGLLEEEGAITKRTRHKGPNEELDSSENKSGNESDSMDSTEKSMYNSTIEQRIECERKQAAKNRGMRAREKATAVATRRITAPRRSQRVSKK